MALITHPILGEITINRRIGARRVRLVVRPSGEVHITHPFLVSRSRTLAFLETKIEWILHTRERMKVCQEQRTYIGSTVEIEALRCEAKSWLPQRVAALAAQHGFRYGRVTIRATHSRWGSCSSENNISLSLFLMRLPEHLRDYVIIHELCHTVHHNHSAAFHALCNHCLDGHEKELSRELRKYSLK